MSIQIKVFASLREQLGRSEMTLDAGQVRTVTDVWKIISSGQPFPSNVLTAVNMEYVDRLHAVQDGDEVAFFPPVTGG